MARAVEDDAIEAKAAGVESAPALFLNGTRLPGEFTYDAIVKALGW
jgi:predicted DsbA family dithiol-disulfide isomerase